MPFKNQAQRRKFAQLLVEGKISPETFEEWNRETGSKKLPEHARKTVKKATRRKATRAADIGQEAVNCERIVTPAGRLGPSCRRAGPRISSAGGGRHPSIRGTRTDRRARASAIGTRPSSPSSD